MENPSIKILIKNLDFMFGIEKHVPPSSTNLPENGNFSSRTSDFGRSSDLHLVTIQSMYIKPPQQAC